AWEDGTAGLWESATGKEVATWRHGGAVNHVAFSRDGARAATASDDGAARVWDPRTGTALTRLMGHRGAVLQVRFHPDGRRVLTAGADAPDAGRRAASG